MTEPGFEPVDPHWPPESGKPMGLYLGDFPLEGFERWDRLFWYQQGSFASESDIAEIPNRLARLDLDHYLRTGRVRDTETGEVFHQCPLYPTHPALCPYSIGAHLGCIWPRLGMPDPETLENPGIGRPWSDPEGRRLFFGDENYYGYWERDDDEDDWEDDEDWIDDDWEDD